MRHIVGGYLQDSMEPACSEAPKEEEDLVSGDGDEGLQQEEAAEKEEEEEEEGEDDAAEDMGPHDNTETNLTPDSLTLVSQQDPSEPAEQNLVSYGDLSINVEELNPNPNPNPSPIPTPYPNSNIDPNPNPNPDPDPPPYQPNPIPNPNPITQPNHIDDEDFLDYRRPQMLTQSHKLDDLLAFCDDNLTIISPSELNIAILSPSELHTIPEITPEEEETYKEDIVMQQESEKENLGGARAHAGVHHDHFSRRSPRLIKSLPPLLPITQQQSMAPPLKANKREQICSRKVPVNEGIKPVNEGIKPINKMNKGNEGSTTPKQRQPALPVNYRSAIKRRVINDSNEHNLPSPSSRGNEDGPSHNCSRASIESSPCLRQQGCISLDDVRRFSTLHITSRSNSRLERFSLRGGKIDRVARFAQLQKIWKKDSFVRAIDGEKRPQILHHLFTPTRTT